MAIPSIEVHTPVGSFLLWGRDDEMHCQVKTPSRIGVVANLSDLPASVRPMIRGVVKRLRTNKNAPPLALVSVV